jgi:hypothetical protein
VSVVRLPLVVDDPADRRRVERCTSREPRSLHGL